MAGRKPAVTDEDILEVFKQSTDPFLATSEVAEQIKITERGTRNRLDHLHEDGELNRKQIGKPHLYWLPTDGSNEETENETDSPLQKFEAMDENEQIEEISRQLMSFFSVIEDMDSENRNRFRTILFRFINRNRNYLWSEEKNRSDPSIPSLMEDEDIWNGIDQYREET